MAAIDLKEAINILKRGEWVSLRFITADTRKGVGGKVIEFSRCRFSRKSSTKTASHEGNLKAQNHHLHFTMNVQLPGGQTRKLHPPLITHINNNEVL